MLELKNSKGFGILEYNKHTLTKHPNEVKQIIHVEEAHNIDMLWPFLTQLPPDQTHLRSFCEIKVYIILIFKLYITINRKS